MATRKQKAIQGEPVAANKAGRRTAPGREVEVEDVEIEREDDEDDASEFFEESDEYPGDRRRDPLRRPV